MACEENPNGFPACPRNQLSLDRLLHDQANRPSRPAFRRVTADHGDDALLLGFAQQRLRTRTLLFVERTLQAFHFVAVSDISDSLGRQFLQRPRRLWCGGTISQVQQGESAKDNPNRLNTAAQQGFKRLTIFAGYIYPEWVTGHTPG